MINTEVIENIIVEDIDPIEILLQFVESGKTFVHLTQENYKEIFDLDEKPDYIILSDILELNEDPQNIIESVKNISDTILVYEYKFDEGCYTPKEGWKTPWIYTGLENFLMKHFDYINQIFLGYSTIHICKLPFNETELNKEHENAIR